MIYNEQKPLYTHTYTHTHINLENDTYELRLRRTDNTTDWKNKPLIPTDTQKIEWQNSLNSFKFDRTKNTNKTT